MRRHAWVALLLLVPLHASAAAQPASPNGEPSAADSSRERRIEGNGHKSFVGKVRSVADGDSIVVEDADPNVADGKLRISFGNVTFWDGANASQGFVIDSPRFAELMHAAFAGLNSDRAYEVRLSPQGELYWLERQDGREARHDTEPGTKGWQRIAVAALSLLPIEWLL